MDRCVCCGDKVPEGRQICFKCDNDSPLAQATRESARELSAKLNDELEQAFRQGYKQGYQDALKNIKTEG